MRKLIFAMIFVSSAARAAVPSQVSVQGVLRDGSGVLQSKMVAVSVSFYDAATNGNKLAGPFGPTQVMATDGLFTFPISDASLSSLAGASSVWMEVTVGSDIFSRQPITPQLSALACGVADAVKGLTITPTGAIGIGTKNPIGQFHIVSDTGGRQNIETFNPSPAPASALVLTRARGTASAPATTVNGDSVFRIQGFAHNGTAMKQVAAIEANVAGVPDSAANVVPGALHFYTSDASASGLRMSITPAGNVGIGTTTPATALEVVGTSNVMLTVRGKNVTDRRGSILLRSTPDNVITNEYEIGTDGDANKTHNFYVYDAVNAITRLRIEGNGNVGIGNAVPTDPFTIGSPASGTLVMGQFPDGGFLGTRNAAGAADVLRLGTGYLERMRIDAAGNVGIGTTTPDATLSVNGSASKAGGGSWTVYSDERLKDIKGAFVAGLDAIRKLQPIRYQYKKDNALGIASNGEHIGFSAQAVQKVIPEAVTTNAKGYLMLNSDPILWTMLNAVKEQQREIESLRARLDRLEGKRTAQR